MGSPCHRSERTRFYHSPLSAEIIRGGSSALPYEVGKDFNLIDWWVIGKHWENMQTRHRKTRAAHEPTTFWRSRRTTPTKKRGKKTQPSHFSCCEPPSSGVPKLKLWLWICSILKWHKWPWMQQWQLLIQSIAPPDEADATKCSWSFTWVKKKKKLTMAANR